MFGSAVTVSPRAMMESPVVEPGSETTPLEIVWNSSVWVLTSHSVMQAEAPSAALPTFPAVQLVQVADDVAPVEDENFPAVQSAHG